MRRPTRVLALVAIAWALAGAEGTGCRPDPSQAFDLYVPQLYPAEPTMRLYVVSVDGVARGPALMGGTFVAGLHPAQDVQLCQSSCGLAVPATDPRCPAEGPAWAPDHQPCVLPCLTWDEAIACYPLRWYPVDVDVRALKRGGVPAGGPRVHVDGAYLGYR